MHADEILWRSSQLQKIDTVARRTLGLDNSVAGSGVVNLNVLLADCYCADQPEERVNGSRVIRLRRARPT